MLQKIQKYGETLYRFCFILLSGDPLNSQVILQNAFYKRIRIAITYWDTEQDKFWFYRQLYRSCRRNWQKKRSRMQNIKIHLEQITNPKEYCFLDVLLNMPQKQKAILYLHWIENYTTNEIAERLRLSADQVTKYLDSGVLALDGDGETFCKVADQIKMSDLTYKMLTVFTQLEEKKKVHLPKSGILVTILLIAALCFVLVFYYLHWIGYLSILPLTQVIKSIEF